MPSSRRLLSLYRLAHVHQEDCSYLFLLEVPCPVDRCCSCTTLFVSTKRTAALPWRGPDHCSRTCSLTHCQCCRSILIAIVIYLAAFWLPRSILVCYPSAHPRTCYPSAHTRTCYPSAHPRTAIQVQTKERAIQVHTQNVLSKCTPKNVLSKCTVYSCTTMDSRAPLVLVHHSVISCTTRALQHTLVHPSRAPLILLHQSRAPLLHVQHSF